MSDYYQSDEEREAAEDRIRRIREGSEPAPAPASPEEWDVPSVEDVSRARGTARAARSALGRDEGYAAPRGAGGRSRTSQAFIVIGGVVAIGVLILLIILLLGSLRGDGGLRLPFGATDTPTGVPATATPAATETPTPTRTAPNLSLPPLTCIFQSGAGCFDYCSDPANQTECNSAKDFVRAQGANPDAWLQCIAAGPGPNTGNPQQCLEDAWRQANP
jgi:hypothetical protein